MRALIFWWIMQAINMGTVDPHFLDKNKFSECWVMKVRLRSKMLSMRDTVLKGGALTMGGTPIACAYIVRPHWGTNWLWMRGAVMNNMDPYLEPTKRNKMHFCTSFIYKKLMEDIHHPYSWQSVKGYKNCMPIFYCAGRRITHSK